jgi:hypothetical protein
MEDQIYLIEWAVFYDKFRFHVKPDNHHGRFSRRRRKD